MAVSIANLAVVFSASTSGMVGGLKIGEKALTSLRASVGNVSVGLQGLASRLTVVGGTMAAIAGAGSLGALVKSQFDAVDATANLSERLGISTEALSAFKWAASQADVPFDSLTASIDKMLVTLADARAGSGEAATALQALGLDIDALTALSPDMAFKRIAQAISEITDPYARANAAQAIFGRGQKDIMLLLQQGSAVFDQAAIDTQRFGTAISGIDAAKVGMADAAFKQLQEAVTGVATRVAVELSPYIAEVSERMVNFITTGEGLKAYVVPGIAAVATGIGYIIDGWNLVTSAVQVVRGGIGGFVGFAVQGIGAVLDGVNYLIEGWNSVAEAVGLTSITVGSIDTESIYNIADAFKDTAAEAIDDAASRAESALSMQGTQAMQDWAASVTNTAGQAAAEIAKTNEALRNQARVTLPDTDEIVGGNKAADALSKIRDEIDAIGQTEIEVKLKAFAEMPGVGLDQIEAYRAALQELDAKKLGEDLRKQLRTPVDDAQEQLDKINTALQAGTISQTEADQLVANVSTQLEELARGKTDVVTPRGTLVTTGSAEAAMIADAQFNRATMKSDSRNDKASKQLEVAKQANNLLDKIARKDPVVINVVTL